MTVETYSVTREDLEFQAAVVAEATVIHLSQHGLLSDNEKALKLLEEWTPVLIPKKSLLERIRSLFQGGETDTKSGGFLIRFAKLK